MSDTETKASPPSDANLAFMLEIVRQQGLQVESVETVVQMGTAVIRRKLTLAKAGGG